MPFAGFAEAARKLVIAFPVLASCVAGGPALAQNREALDWYARGLHALDERHYSEARADLLQAVQADPSFAGAWLDLAIAAYGDGDPVEAEEFLAILEARFAVPPPIEKRVADLRAQIDRQKAIAGNTWRWAGTFQAGTGLDTNANAGLALRDLTLTFPGGPVILPIAEAQLPRRDGYVMGSFLVEGQRPTQGGQVEAAGSIRSRVNGHLRAYDTVELQSGVAYVSTSPVLDGRLPVLTGPWRIGASVQQLRLGGSALMESASLTAAHAWKDVRCSPQGGIEFGMRHFPVAGNLDSHLYWLTGMATCENPWAGPGARATAQVRLGYESGRGDFETASGRPGDDTRHLEVTLLQHWDWQADSGQHRVEAQFQWASAADTRGYSPLLGSNTPRRLARWTASVSYSVPLPPSDLLGKGWVGTASLQAFRQRSNLELFRLKGEVFQFGLQKTW